MESASSEQLLIDTPANMWRGAEAVGGRLHVTNQRVIFKSHSFNIQTGETQMLLGDIQSVSPVNTLGIVHNGLLITLKSGEAYKFVTWGRQTIINIIIANLSRIGAY